MEYRKVKIVEKPWGREIWFAVEKEYAGKILEIEADSRTSMQYHRKKKESMYVLKGKLKVVTPKGEFYVKKGESITIKPGQKHRLCAEKKVLLIEVSTPEIDDVVRLEDDYGRK